MTVGELLARISAEELTEWIAYERMNGPLGPVRGDWQAAMIASTVYHTGASKKAKKRKLRDFLLRWSGSRRVQSAEEMEAIGRQLAAMHGGTFTEGSER